MDTYTTVGGAHIVSAPVSPWLLGFRTLYSICFRVAHGDACSLEPILKLK